MRQLGTDRMRLGASRLLAVVAIASGCASNDGQFATSKGDPVSGPHPHVPAAGAVAPKPAPPASVGIPNVRVDKRVLSELDTKGSAEFLVMLRSRAALSGASAIKDWAARGRWVHEQLTLHAQDTQREVVALLQQQNVTYRAFWIVNAILVKDGTKATVERLRQLPGVRKIAVNETHRVPEPRTGVDQPRPRGLEWGLESIRAPEAWDGFGVQGEGVVVANIDTGVEHTHSALVAQYRGNNGDGTYDHDYNWFDPSGICGDEPCDNAGHGTHTMGTMVGDDGDPGDNRIGVAPKAQWIAAKGCESFFCSSSSLIASAEWIAAPTDSSGENPRPDLRPNIVNNSWGGPPGDDWYQEFVDAWVAAGIFPAFSNGNSGSSCGYSGTPGEYINSYSSGAYDSSDNIAAFSSRGPSSFEDEIKPNIAAPGVNVRSSLPGDGYGSYSGTSMASPHLAGTVALMWSAAPALVGDIDATRAILDDSATDVDDTSCGGTADDNNVWGEGKVDAYAAVEQSPRGPTGTLVGLVSDSSNGMAIQGARVSVTGPLERRVRSAPDGRFSLRLSVGDYTVHAQAFGYLEQSASASITEDAETTQNFALVPAPTYVLAGTVTDDDGAVVASASVRLVGTPLSTETDDQGSYRFDAVPEGSYTLRVEPVDHCLDPMDTDVDVLADQTLDVELARRNDDFGHSCRTVTPAYIPGTQRIGGYYYFQPIPVQLPFGIDYYGTYSTTAYVSPSGYVEFGDRGWYSVWNNSRLPSSRLPNHAAFVMWDDLFPYFGQFLTASVGTAPERKFVIEWRDMAFWSDYRTMFDFEIVLHEKDSSITMQYRKLKSDDSLGRSATIGIENEEGTDALQYSYNKKSLQPKEFAIAYKRPPLAYVQGTVIDRNDTLPIAGARITVRDGSGAVVRRTKANEMGFYRTGLALGTYSVEASYPHYVTESQTATLAVLEEATTLDYSLATARAELTPKSFEIIVPAEQRRERTITLSNTGSTEMTWSLYGQARWLSAAPSHGRLGIGQTTTVTLFADTTQLPVGWYRSRLSLQSNSGRRPYESFPVKLVVPRYRQGLNAGCSGSSCPAYPTYIDANGDSWDADRPYQVGDAGYTQRGEDLRSHASIAMTPDPLLYQYQHEEPYAYRFDGLAPGEYEVEVLFAELDREKRAGERYFDVIVLGKNLLPAYDITYDVGQETAAHHNLFVRVGEDAGAGGSGGFGGVGGRGGMIAPPPFAGSGGVGGVGGSAGGPPVSTDEYLDIRLIIRSEFETTSIGAVRVTHRPDRETRYPNRPPPTKPPPGIPPGPPPKGASPNPPSAASVPVPLQ